METKLSSLSGRSRVSLAQPMPENTKVYINPTIRGELPYVGVDVRGQDLRG